MRSSELSSVSAVVQLLLGLLALFLPRALFPAAGASVEAGLATQLLGAAWLGAACLNWLSREALLGGIHGRGIIAGNLTLYLVSTLLLLRPALDLATPLGLRLLPLLLAPIAILYAMRLLRGPSERDLEPGRGDSPPG